MARDPTWAGLSAIPGAERLRIHERSVSGSTSAASGAARPDEPVLGLQIRQDAVLLPLVVLVVDQAVLAQRVEAFEALAHGPRRPL